MKNAVIEEIIKNLRKAKTKEDFLKLKRDASKKYKTKIPSNAAIIEKLSEKELKKF